MTASDKWTERALRFLLSCVLFCWTQSAFAQGETGVPTPHADTTRTQIVSADSSVAGNVSGFWPRATYLVTDGLTVSAGDTLVIEAGSTILFQAPKDREKLSINCLGRLIVAGQDSAPVTFASAIPEGGAGRIWGGILYVGNMADGRVENAVFRNAEIGIQVRRGIIADRPAEADSANPIPEYILRRPTGPVVIRNCTIDSASFNGLVFVGVDSSVVAENNLIQNCSSGISCEEGARPVLRLNRILNNTSTGIICSSESSPLITGNTVVGSSTAGIICANNSNPTIDGCIIAKNGIGISVTKSNPMIARCTIAKNEFSGIIAYEGAAPIVSACNIRGNGLSGIDNRSSGNVAAERVWWGFITTDQRKAPVLDGGRRRERGEPVPEGQTGSVRIANSLSSPSLEAPGTPRQAQELILARDNAITNRFPERGEVSNGDTVWIQVRAVDESPYLEDEAIIVFRSSSGGAAGTQRVLTESSASSGIYKGYVIASLAEGDPNIVVQVRNGDVITVETGTTPPLSARVVFVSKPPAIQNLRVDGQRRGARLTNQRPVFSWRYWDNENDPQRGTELELSTDSTFLTQHWKHAVNGPLSSYTFDGPALTRGQTYFLRVRASDGYNFGRWSVTSFHMNTPPPTPTLASPEDGAILTDPRQKPVIAVRNVRDADGDAVSYIFQAAYGEDFSSARLRAGGPEASLPVPEDPASDITVWRAMPPLYENTRIWWRAKATDGTEESEWSAPRSFSLNTANDPPTPFVMLQPERDSTTNSLTPRLEWSHSYDPDPGETISFVVAFGRNKDLRDAVIRHVEPVNEPVQSYQLTPSEMLLDNTSYYWTVRLEQDGRVLFPANTAARDTTSVWRFFVDTGNDPPVVAGIPPVVMTEDTPYKMNLGRYISDPDHPTDALKVTVTGTEHLTAALSPGNELTLTPAQNWYGGPERVRILVVDPILAEANGEISVSVTPVNDPPALAQVPNQSIEEDTDLRVDLKPFISDVDNTASEMRWTATADTRKLTISFADGVATIRGTQDWFGTTPVRVTATDTGGLSASSEFNVSVTPVNDPPAVVQIPSIRTKEDEAAVVQLDNYVTDPDNQKGDLRWSAVAEEPLTVTIDPATRRATISAPQNWAGAERKVTFTVTDPDGLSDRIVVAVGVEAVNDPPTIAAIPDQRFNEDATLTLDLDPFVSDPDNTAREMTWTAASGANIRAAVDAATRRVTFSASTNWYGGPEAIRLTATDPGGLRATQSVNVSVISVPEAPVFARIPAVIIDEDGQFVLALDEYLSDPDHRNDQLTVSFVAPQNVKVELDRRTRRLTLSAPPNWNGGPETVSLEAVDPDNERASATFAVTVRPVNDPPALRAIPPVAFREDESATLRLTEFVTDPDNTPEQIQWSFTGQSHVKVQTAQGVATFSADRDWNGTETLTLKATDPGGLFAQTQVRVNVTPVNDAPVLRQLPPVAFDEDGSSTVRLFDFVSDVDNTNEQLTWEVSGNSRIKVAIARGTATFTAEPNWHGAENLTITVADPDGLRASSSFAATVRSVNDPPVIARIPPVSFEEDGRTTVDLAPFGSDADGDALTWTAASANPNLRVSVSGSVLTLSAAPDWNGGPVNVTVTATDPSRGQATTTIPVTVTAVNDPPALKALAPVTFAEDGSATLNLLNQVADPDNTPAQMRWDVSGADKVKVRVVQGVATFSAEPNWHGSETLTIAVTDPGGLSARGTVPVTVTSVNDPPVISRLSPVSFNEDESAAVDLAPFGSDPDGDPLTWSATSANPNVRVAVSGTMLTISAVPDWSGGPVNVTVTATDPSAAKATGVIPVSVTAVNDPPTLKALAPVTFAEDGSATLNLLNQVADPDNTPAQMRWDVSGADKVKVRVVQGVATFSAEPNWHGSETLTIAVTDPGGLSARGTLPVTVTSVNDPPVISRLSPVSFNEDESAAVDLAPFGSDPDGDPLTWSATSANPNVRVAVSGAMLTISALPDWSGGPVNITVTATDPAGAKATATIPVTVRAVNDPPELRALPSVNFNEDSTATLRLAQYVSDKDNTPAQMSWQVSGNTNVRVRFAQNVATFSAEPDWSGSESVTITVSDPQGGSSSQNIQVTVRPVNDRPRVQPIPDATVEAGGHTEIDLAPFASDPDRDPLTWQVAGQTGRITPVVTGSTLRITAAEGAAGAATVNLVVRDPAGAQATARVRITIQAAAPVQVPSPRGGRTTP